jgi:hypothetical protein
MSLDRGEGEGGTRLVGCMRCEDEVGLELVRYLSVGR